MKNLRVYIAGPYSGSGDVIQNIAAAIEAGNRVLDLGHTPFIPHLNAFWHLAHPHPSYVWLAWDKEWLKVCDALIRLPGKSPGSDEEVELAKAWGISVYHSVDEFKAAHGAYGFGIEGGYEING